MNPAVRLSWPLFGPVSLHARPDRRYRAKLSGPLLDRIDIRIDVPAVPQEELMQQSAGENSHAVRRRVSRRKGSAGAPGQIDGELLTREIDQVCAIEDAASTLLRQAIVRLNFSARAYHRVLKLARTIADLAGIRASALRMSPRRSSIGASTARAGRSCSWQTCGLAIHGHLRNRRCSRLLCDLCALLEKIRFDERQDRLCS